MDLSDNQSLSAFICGESILFRHFLSVPSVSVVQNNLTKNSIPVRIAKEEALHRASFM